MDKFIDRRKSDSIKWRKYPEDILPLWVADMDFPSPPEVIHALNQRVNHGIFGYPFTDPELLEVIIAWVKQKHNWNIQPEDIVLLPGVVDGLNLTVQAFTKPGDNIIIQTPVYGPFLQLGKNANVELRNVPLITNDTPNYLMDFDKLEAALDSNSRVFMLCNPQNPTGRVFTKEELESLATLLLKQDIIICSDEIHCDIVYPPHKHIPIASISEDIANRTITLMSPSKTFNIAGLKVAFAIIPNAKLRELFTAARRGLSIWVNVLGQVAAKAAFMYGDSWLVEILEILEENRNYLADFINKELQPIKMTKPEGTYLAWLDCRELELQILPDQFFLKYAKVALNDGRWFGDSGEGFVRLNFACHRKHLQRALMQIKQSLPQIECN